MNTAKKIFQIVLGITITTTVIAGVLVYLTTKYPQLFGTKVEPTPTPTEAPAFISSLLLGARTEGSKILVVISPLEGSFNLHALSLKATLKGERGIPIVKELTPNQDLIKSGWYFPIKNTSRDQNGNVVIEISALHTGKSFYPVSKELIIASLDFSDIPNTGALSLTTDQDITKFLTSDATLSKIKVVTEDNSEDNL